MNVAESWSVELAAPVQSEGCADVSFSVARDTAPELAIIIPTLNERDNVPILVQQLNRDLSGPMSGFFMIRRGAFAETMRALSGQGFKILLDLFASAPRPLAFAEVPLNFRQRLHGESKLDAMVAWEYLMLLLQKLVGPVF